MTEVIALQNEPLEEQTSAGHCPRWVLLQLLPSSASHHALNQVLEMNFFKHVPLAECAFPRPGRHPRSNAAEPSKLPILPPALSAMESVWEAKQTSEPLGARSPSENKHFKKYFLLSAFIWSSFQKGCLPLYHSSAPRPYKLTSQGIFKFMLCKASTHSYLSIRSCTAACGIAERRKYDNSMTIL